MSATEARDTLRHPHADRWRFLPEADAAHAPKSGFCQILRNRWWVVCPKRGLVFCWRKGVKGLGSPQCNSSESISRRLGSPIEDAEIKFVPLVLVPIHLEDWR